MNRLALLLLALIAFTLTGHADAQTAPGAHMPICWPGQVPQVSQQGWFCNGGLQHIDQPILAGAVDLNFGAVRPRQCVEVRTQHERANDLHAIYSVTATVDHYRSAVRWTDRGGSLVLSGAYAEAGELIVEVCNHHESDEAKGDGLRVQWVAVHADP